MFDFINNNIWIAALIGSALTFLGNAIWQRWFRAVEEILQKGPVSDREYKLLAKETEKHWIQWKKMAMPPSGGQKRIWPQVSPAIFPRDLNMREGDSACPSGDPTSPDVPLYLKIDSSEIVDIASEIRKKFEQMSSHDELSQKLLQRGQLPEQVIPKVWISTLRVILKNRSQVIDLREEATKTVRTWIPGAQVVLEIFLAVDIVREQFTRDNSLTLSPRMGRPQNPHNLNPASRYALERELANVAIKNGILVGNPRTSSQYPIPPKVLEERLSKKLYLENIPPPSQWKAIVISGPPGAGKTETAFYIAQQLSNQYKCIVLNISTPQLLAAVEKLPDESTKQKAFESLINAIQNTDSSGESAIPQKFRETSESTLAFKDALYKAIIDNEQPTILLVDDLHVYRGVKKSLIKVSQMPWKLNLILIERPGRIYKELATDKREVTHIQLPLWGREDARKLLSLWVPEQHIQKLARIFEDKWLSHQEHYSLYLLKTIVEYVDDLKSNSNELITKALIQHLSSVTVAYEMHQPTTSILDKIRHVLELQDLTHEQRINQINAVISYKPKIGILDLFGPLAWYSMYSESNYQNAFLDAGNIVRWSQGIIKTHDEAKRFLEKGADSQIFALNSGEAVWKDSFVADGCAALYLSTEIDRGLPDNILAEMVIRLDEFGSIDIIKLVLDTPHLRHVIEAITKVTPSSAAVLDKLVTFDLVQRLAQKSGFVDRFGYFLFRQAQNFEISQILPYVRALAKVWKLSKEVKQYCKEMSRDTGSNTEVAQTALSVYAFLGANDPRYFSSMRELEANELLAFTVACWYWNIQGGDVLIGQVMSLATKEYPLDKLIKSWAIWCQRQPAFDLLEFLKRLLGQIWGQYQENEMNIVPLLIGTGLEHVIRSKPGPTQEQLEPLQHAVLRLANEGKINLAGEIAKWIAYHYSPTLVDRGSNWVVDPDRLVAFPTVPNDPKLLNDILQILSNNAPLFFLPTSQQLKKHGFPTEGKLELVSDNLPYDRISTKGKKIEIERRHTQIWDGVTLRQLTEDRNSVKLLWRPTLRLSALP